MFNLRLGCVFAVLLLAPGSMISCADEAVAKPSIDDQPVRGTVIDGGGQPVEGATVVAGVHRGGEFERQVLMTDAAGQFITPYKFRDRPMLMAYQPGWAIDAHVVRELIKESGEVTFILGPAEPFVVRLQDAKGRPVAKAKVRIEVAAVPEDGQLKVYKNFGEKLVTGTPADDGVTAVSDAQGLARCPGLPAEAQCMLTVLAPGMGRFVSLANNQRPFYSGTEKHPAEITLTPEARIAGRVVTKLPGVSVAGRTVSLRAAPGSGVVADPYKVTTDAEGRFEFGGLVAGTCNLYLIDHEPDGPCTYVVAQDAVTKPGEVTAVTIELIEGRMVEGQVTDPEGRPLAEVLVHVPLLPRGGGAILGYRTKADGKYRFRLPPGEFHMYISDPSKGYARANTSHARLEVEGTGPLAGPKLIIHPTRAVQLRLVDDAGNPATDVEIRRLSNHEQFLDLSQRPLRPDAEGRVTLDRDQPLPFATGQRIVLQVHHKDGRMVEVNETVPDGPELSIRVP